MLSPLQTKLSTISNNGIRDYSKAEEICSRKRGGGLHSRWWGWCTGVLRSVQIKLSGCLYASKEFSIRILRALVQKVWKLQKLKVVKVRTNVIQIFFKQQTDMELYCGRGHVVFIITFSFTTMGEDQGVFKYLFQRCGFWLHVGDTRLSISRRRLDGNW